MGVNLSIPPTSKRLGGSKKGKSSGLGCGIAEDAFTGSDGSDGTDRSPDTARVS